MGEELRVIKITNPFWLGKVGPFIADFLKKVPIAGVTYESLYTYLSLTCQNGAIAIDRKERDRAEMWVVFDEDAPIAFAHWYVKQLPSVGIVFCDFIYSWQRKKQPAGLLLDEFKRFGEAHRAQLWEASATNRSVFDVLSRGCVERGMEVKETGQVNFVVMRRQEV